MQELFPLLAGACIGLLIERLRAPARLKVTLFIVLCLSVGALASWLSGELEISGAFISFDTALVWLGALLAVGLSAAWRRARAARA